MPEQPSDGDDALAAQQGGLVDDGTEWGRQVSTPAEDRPALAEKAARAMIVARTSLEQAVNAADEVESRLGWREFDIAELEGDANRVRGEAQPEPFLRSAQASADTLDERLRDEQGVLGRFVTT